MQKAVITVLIIASLAFAVQCRFPTGPGTTDDPPVYWASVPDSTRPADAATMNALSDVSPDSSILTFTGTSALLDALANGDVLVLGTSDLTPGGLLRKVTGINRSAGQVIVTTVQTTLEHAVEEGRLGLSTTLASDGIKPGSLLGSHLALSVAPNRVQPRGLAFDVSYTVVPGITVSGEISFDIDLELDLDIKNFSLDRAAFITTTEYEADLRFAIDLDDPAIDAMVEVGSIHFAPIVVPAGPISLVFVPELSINVGVEGAVSADTEIAIYQHATLRAGAEYDGAWSEVKEFTSSFTHQTPAVEAACSLKGYIGPKLSIKLYDIVGPYANIYGFLELDAAMVGSEAWWELYGGLDLGAGLEVEVMGHSVADWDAVKLIEYRRLLASGSGATSHNWELQTVDRYSQEWSAAKAQNSVAVDSAGGIHIAYGFDDNQLKYAHFDGDVWTYTVVDDRTAQRAMPCIDVDAAGSPFIAYVRDTGSPDLYLARKVNGLWTIALVDTANPYQDNYNLTSLKIDSSGNPRIAYKAVKAGTKYEVKYAAWNGTAWDIESVYYPDDTAMIRLPSLALDAGGNPHVAFTHSWRLYHAWRSGGSWYYEEVTVAGTNLANLSVSIDVDTQGYPHIGYRNYGDDIMYIWKHSGGWSDPSVEEKCTVDDVRFNSGYLSFVLDGNDVPHFCWYDFDSDSLLYSVWQGSGWSTGTVDATAATVGKPNFMTVSSTAPYTPYVSYYDETNRYLKLARWTGE